MTNGAGQGAVVVGIIDDGIAFAHERFRTVAGGNIESRVEFWWLQDGAYAAPPPPVPLPPMPPIFYGSQLCKAEIDYFLNQCMTTPGRVDEEDFYRRAGLTDFRLYGHKSAAWRLAHGSHVMDLACGYDQDKAPDDRPIVCVQLPVRTTADTSGGTLFPHVHQAIHYILDCAQRIAAGRGADRLPVVINLSYGYFAGPHDGTSHIEVMIDRVVAQSKRRGVELRVVLPAGNSYLSRTHAQISFGLDDQKDEVVSLNWRILPDGKTPSYLEIWLPYSAPPIGANRLKVTLTSPTGQSWSVDELGPPQQFGAGPFYGELRYAFRGGPTQRAMFRATVNATKNVVDQDPAFLLPALAPAGVWKVQLQNRGLARGEVVHLWVQRDDSFYGFPLRGRQSFLDNERYHGFDNEGRDNEVDDPTCPVRRASTINAIATGQQPIVLGGFLRKEMRVAKYSSSGPITPAQAGPAPDPYRPDAILPTDDSRVHHGLLAAGSRSGSVVAMNGTSVAAPQIARAIADDLAAGGNGDRATVRGWVNCDPASPTPPPLADRSGAGGIDLPPLIALQRYWT